MISRFLILIPILAVAACSTGGDSGSTSASTSTGARIRDASEWVDENARDSGFKQDASGNMVPKSDKRSSFETNRKSAYFKGEYNKKEFKTADYTKKSWWGKSEYARKSYAGNTDGSRFQQSSRLQGLTSREAGTSARLPGTYDTGSYATSTANEAGSTRLGRPSDAESDVRRRVFTEPSVIEWQAQRQMTVGKSRGILGR